MVQTKRRRRVGDGWLFSPDSIDLDILMTANRKRGARIIDLHERVGGLSYPAFEYRTYDLHRRGLLERVGRGKYRTRR